MKKKYLDGKRPDAKAWHHKEHRVGFQRNSPQNNFRRLIACHIPPGEFCCDTVSYFPEKGSKLPLNLLLALFNSKLLDWFFRLGSTNSKVNILYRMAGMTDDEVKGLEKRLEGML
jgi:hypothetical protein